MENLVKFEIGTQYTGESLSSPVISIVRRSVKSVWAILTLGGEPVRLLIRIENGAECVVVDGQRVYASCVMEKAEQPTQEQAAQAKKDAQKARARQKQARFAEEREEAHAPAPAKKPAIKSTDIEEHYLYLNHLRGQRRYMRKITRAVREGDMATIEKEGLLPIYEQLAEADRNGHVAYEWGLRKVAEEIGDIKERIKQLEAAQKRLAK